MKEWVDKYEGEFDDDWNKYGESVCARQKAMRYIREKTQLPRRPETLAARESSPECERSVQRRLIELFGGFTEHVDVQIGRLVNELRRLGYGDDTFTRVAQDR